MRIGSVLVATMAVIALAFAGLGGVARVSAQDGPFAAAGLPELAITLTDAGLEGVPAETAAGWHLVTFTNNITPTGDPFEDTWQVDFVQVPAGTTAEELGASLLGPPPGAEGEASPESMEGMEMGSPEAGAAPEDPFAVLYDTYLAGGPGALQGETGQGVVFLQAGDYAVLALGLTEAEPMTVTGEADMASGVVTGDVTITEVGTSGSFDFQATLSEGPGVLEIYNDSDQPHFIFAIRSDVPLTEDEVLTLLSEEEPPAGATPEAAAAEPPPIAPGFITGVQSPETTQYIAVDLQPGYYVLLCFVGDPQMDGLPHAFTGMIEVVPVGVDAGTPSA